MKLINISWLDIKKLPCLLHELVSHSLILGLVVVAHWLTDLLLIISLLQECSVKAQMRLFIAELLISEMSIEFVVLFFLCFQLGGKIVISTHHPLIRSLKGLHPISDGVV